jgi:hypothetical protein
MANTCNAFNLLYALMTMLMVPMLLQSLELGTRHIEVRLLDLHEPEQ